MTATDLAVTVVEPGQVTLAFEPSLVVEEAHRAAATLKKVLDTKEKPVFIGNEQYIEFEDWQLLGKFYGVTAKEDGDPEPVEFDGVRGFKASAFAVSREGVAVSRATAYCMRDESKKWREAPLFQVSSQAQTRACAKALRNVLSWVVVLAGYKPTPAEELIDQAGPVVTRGRGPVPPRPQSVGPIEYLDDREDESLIIDGEAREAPAQRLCNCGQPRVRRSGERNGRAWVGWFCVVKQPNGTKSVCDPVFENQM